MRNYAVRLSVDGAQVVEGTLTRVGQRGQEAMRRIGTASNQASQGLRQLDASAGRFNRGAITNTAFQVQDFAVQVSSGTRASTALAQQLPQLLGGFGALGAVIGAGVAIGVPLLARAFSDASDSGRDLDDVMGDLQSSASSVNGIISDLRDVQTAYAQAISGTATAQNIATKSIIADTKAEFEAKKALLDLEIKRQRGLIEVAKGERTALQAQVRDEIADQGPSLTASRQQIFRNPNRTTSNGGNSIPIGIRTPFEFDRTREILDYESPAVDRVKELTAQTTLAEIGLRKLEEAASSTFSTIEGGSGGGIVPDTGGGGGGGGARGAARAVEDVGDKAQDTTQDMRALAAEAARVDAVNRALASSFSTLFTDAISGAKGFGESLSQLLRQLGNMAISNAFLTIVGRSGLGASPFGQTFSALFGATPGFATGGSFKVGGSGGTDSQLVTFRATPGEMVDVRRPADARGGAVSLNFAPTINAQGADASALARVQAQLDSMRADFRDMVAEAVSDPRMRGAI